MKTFLLDDSDALGQYISRQSQNNPILEIYWPNLGEGAIDKHELSNLDDYFSNLLNEDVWQRIDQQDGSCQEIMTLLASSDCNLFLININLKFRATAFRQDQDGVELLKHIRLTEELGEARNFHVALYSFEEQLELLKRKPGNIMMLSKGVSFHRLPECLPNLTIQTFMELAKKQANVADRNFQRFVQCDYQPPDSAHQFSNWWGLHQIVKSRKEQGLPDIEAPSVLNENLIKLENKKTLFLNDWENSKSPIHIGNNQLDFYKQIPIGSRIIYIDDEQHWREFLSTALERDFKNPRSDDKSSNQLKVRHLQPEISIFLKDGAIEEWITRVIPKDTNASLILLDMRLLGNNEINKAVEETSGIKLAKQLRKSHPGLPIILLTASNKAYSYSAAMKLGIDGYWMKEGVGEHAPQGGSFKNYLDLLNLISRMLSPEYRFLRRFSQRVSILRNVQNNHNYWWNHYVWDGVATTSITKEKVFNILDGVVILLREYLRLFYLNHGYGGENGKIRESWVCALIVEAAKVIELVHGLDRFDRCIENGKTIFLTLKMLTKARGDKWGGELYFCRNIAAHANDKKPDFLHAQSMLAGVLTHLQIAPDLRSNISLWNSTDFVELNGRQAADFQMQDGQPLF